MAGVTPPPSVAKTCTKWREGLVVDHRDNARIEELNNLRLALATFALHLDAFEMQVSAATSGLTTSLGGPSLLSGPSLLNPARPRDIALRLQKVSRSGRR
jgi:hypothetical protein